MSISDDIRTASATGHPMDPDAALFSVKIMFPDNKVCFDCKAKDPTCVSFPNGVFICERCSNHHNELGFAVGNFRSENARSWPSQKLRMINFGGNDRAVLYLDEGVSTGGRINYVAKYSSPKAVIHRDSLLEEVQKSLNEDSEAEKACNPGTSAGKPLGAMMTKMIAGFCVSEFAPQGQTSNTLEESVMENGIQTGSSSSSKLQVTVEGLHYNKKEARLCLSNKKNDNFWEWYSEVVVSGEMIEYYNISGCYILMPWTMSIWEIMRGFFDAEIKKMEIKNCYFPLLVSPGVLQQQEMNHIEGFAPEVAWATKCGESELEVPIAIRHTHTSEAVTSYYFSKWISGHIDLPLKLNQWCNAVRWEVSHPIPFIRSREFLWQEGHTAFASKEDADAEVRQILELYRRIYKEYLAIPVLMGWKSKLEKFAGGLYTCSVEAFIPVTGCGIQGATSNCLGQNFANKFDIEVKNDEGEKGMVWQNSWAYSTRTIGVMVMVHGDDDGLVLPPKVAPTQVIVIPVCEGAITKAICDACSKTVKELHKAGIRAEADLRDSTHSWKMLRWQIKGVPLRIEIYSKDLKNKKWVRAAVRRDNSARVILPKVKKLAKKIKKLLATVQENLFDVANQKMDPVKVFNWEQFVEALQQKRLIFAPWCGEEEVEKNVKVRTSEMGAAKTLCSPFEQPEIPDGTLCFTSETKLATIWTYWGRSY